MFLGVEAANAAAIVQTTPATWISLHDGDPGTTGANELGVARQQTSWGAAVDGARGGAEVFFPVAAGTRVTHWGLWTEAGEGTFYSGHRLDEETFGHTGVYALLPVISPGEEVQLAGDGPQAAVLLNWGPVVDGDEFPGDELDLGKWGLYNGPGHANKGLRRPSQIDVNNGVLTITGLPNGTTGGMSFNTDRLHGRWESRMRIPPGDYRYHPVLLLWPDAEDWPVGGEVDYAETNCAADDVDFFLHYSASNLQTHDSVDVDITEWHNYAVEWTASWIRGYVDGVMFFEDTNPAHLPPRAMHPTIQLDWFPSSSDLTPVQQSTMEVAWLRVYDLDEVPVSPASPTFIGVTGSSGSGTSLALSPPSGVTSGDHQLVVLGLGSTGETFSAAPAGWSLLQQTSDAGGSDSYRVAVFYSNVDAGPVSFGKSAATRLMHGVRCAWRGGTGPDLATDTFVVDATGTSHPLPGQDAVPAGSTVVGAIVVDQGDELVTSFTAPAGWTERYDASPIGGDTETTSIAVFDFPVVVTGDVDGTVTASRSDGSITFSVVLRPSTSGGGGGGPATLVQDSFVRADSPSSLGNATTGQAWAPQGGSTWGVVGGQAKTTASSSASVLADAGRNDLRVSAKITRASGGNNAGVLFRVLDDSNRLGLFLNLDDDKFQLWKTVSGTSSVMAEVPSVLLNSTAYAVEVVAEGSSIKGYLNGVLLIDYTLGGGELTQYTGAGYTRVGMRGSSTASWDDFVARALA